MLRRLLRALRPPLRPPSPPVAPPALAPAPLPAPWTLRDEGLAAVVDTDFDVDFADGGGLVALHPGVYAGRVLGEVWCRRMAREVRAYEAALRAGARAVEPPNSMHQYGIPLEAMGLGGLGMALFHGPLWERSRALLPGVSGALHRVTGFVVRYGEGGDLDLGQHVDDADATLSLCLEGDAEGSEVIFEGLRCGLHLDHPLRPGERFAYAHRPGQAVLHSGKHRHRVAPIRRGTRLGLILWARALASRERFEAAAAAGHCPAWCGLA